MKSKNWFANFLLLSGTLFICFLTISANDQNTAILLSTLGAISLISGIAMNIVFILLEAKNNK